DRLAAALNRRSVLAAAALPYPLERAPEYLAQLRSAATSPAAADTTAAAFARSWPDLTLPLPKFTRPGRARIGVMSTVTDADGVVRRLSPLHRAYGEIVPSLPLASLLAAEPDAALSVEPHGYRVGAR